MAITDGVGPHSAWLNVDGTKFLIETGNVTQSAVNKSSQFICTMPLSEPGAFRLLATTSGKKCTIEVMTRGVTKTLLTGVADEAAFDLIGRTISVAGRDRSAALHEQKTSDKWLNKKTTEIVKELAERAGIKADVKTLETMAGKMLEQDHVKLSDGVSFSTVMNKLAEIDNARWWVDADGTLRYVPFGSSSGSYSIFVDQTGQPIKSDCLRLRIHRNLQAAKRIKVRYRAWHTRKKRVHEYEATVPGTEDEQVFTDSIPGLQQDQVEKYAKSKAAELARHEITVRATVVGDPAISGGMGLSLTGTEHFDQSYEMDTVHHDFGMRGHTTSMTARAARKGRTAS